MPSAYFLESLGGGDRAGRASSFAYCLYRVFDPQVIHETLSEVQPEGVIVLLCFDQIDLQQLQRLQNTRGKIHVPVFHRLIDDGMVQVSDDGELIDVDVSSVECL